MIRVTCVNESIYVVVSCVCVDLFVTAFIVLRLFSLVCFSRFFFCYLSSATSSRYPSTTSPPVFSPSPSCCYLLFVVIGVYFLYWLFICFFVSFVFCCLYSLSCRYLSVSIVLIVPSIVIMTLTHICFFFNMFRPCFFLSSLI